MNQHKVRFWPVVPLLAIFLLAATLFISGMAHEPLWIDEAFGIEVSSQPTVADVWSIGRGGLHPPLFYMLQHFNPALTDNLISMRIVSYFLAIIGVALTYRLAADVFQSRRVALMAALVVATSDLLIALSPLFRFFTLYMALSLLATWLYWRYSRRWKISLGVAYTITAILLLYTLYWGGFVLIGHGLHMLIYHRKRLLHLAIPAIVVALAYLPWLPSMLFQMREGLPESGYHSALEVDADGMDILLFQLFGVPRGIFITLTLAGLVASFNARRFQDYLPNERTMLMAMQFAGVLFIPIAIDVFLDYGLLNHRSMIALVPVLAILIAHVLSQMRFWAYLLMGAVLLVNNLTTIGAQSPLRGPWEEATDFVSIYGSPDDQIIVETTDILQFHALKHHFKLDIDRDEAMMVNGDTLTHYLDQRGTSLSPIWLVEYFDDLEVGQPQLVQSGYQAVTPSFNSSSFLNDTITVTYYVQPPEEDALPYRFDEALTIADFGIDRRGDDLVLNLLWRTLRSPSVDYTVSAFLLHPTDGLVAQHDSPPLDGLSPTSAWLPNHHYFDRRILDTAALSPSTYELAVQIYLWRDGIQNIPVAPCEDEPCHIVVLDEIVIGE